jgi:Xaa-Pro aminopeptidase
MTTPASALRKAVHLPPDHYRRRVAAIQERIGTKCLDGLLVLNAANLMWATGFFHIPNERPLGLYVPAQGSPLFLAPLLEQENTAETWVADVRCYEEYPGITPAEVWMMDEVAGERLAVDSASHAAFEQMRRRKPLLALDDTIQRMRYLKSADEIELTRQAAAYADYGLQVARDAVAEGLSRGITELEVVKVVQAQTIARMQAELQDLINFYRGAVALTAHTGQRGALPHGHSGPNPIEYGHTLIVGIGVKVGGYHAESGCTFVIGEPTPDQRACLEATWACDEAALAALRPGNRCLAVNEAAWDVLRERGYGPYIRHRIGHGMGVEGHEAPWLSLGDETELAPTMVFSNEPGIYRPGVDGYRIIDSMLVTEGGGERLSRYLSEHGPDDRVIG